MKGWIGFSGPEEGGEVRIGDGKLLPCMDLESLRFYIEVPKYTLFFCSPYIQHPTGCVWVGKRETRETREPREPRETGGKKSRAPNNAHPILSVSVSPPPSFQTAASFFFAPPPLFPFLAFLALLPLSKGREKTPIARLAMPSTAPVDGLKRRRPSRG